MQTMIKIIPSMKKHISFLFFLLLTINFAVGQNGRRQAFALDSVQEAFLEPLKAQFAPDARDVYFKAIPQRDGSVVIETTSTDMQSYLKTQTTPFKIEVKVLPDADLQGKIYGLINLSVANLRTRGAHSAEMATQATLGTPVDVLKKERGFFLIRTPDQYLSWVDSYGITQKTAEEMAEWHKAKKLVYLVDYGHAYDSPDNKQTRVSDLVMGDIFRAGKKVGEKQEIIFPDGRTGFVSLQEVLDFEQWVANRQPVADSIIAVAKTMMGVPYLWGGTSIKGVDCSGFTKTAYYMNGLILPRDASQQARAGVAVDVMSGEDLDVQKAIKNLKKGDLIFFSGSKTTNPKKPVTHVALYLGDGEFIHAAGRVRINSFDPKAWNYDAQSETIVSARRFLDSGQSLPTLATSAVY